MVARLSVVLHALLQDRIVDPMPQQVTPTRHGYRTPSEASGARELVGQLVSPKTAKYIVYHLEYLKQCGFYHAVKYICYGISLLLDNSLSLDFYWLELAVLALEVGDQALGMDPVPGEKKNTGIAGGPSSKFCTLLKAGTGQTERAARRRSK